MKKFVKSIEKDEKIAIIFNEKEYTYEELIDQISDFEMQLTKNGIKQGKRVVILGDYSFHSIALFFALSNLNTVIIPISSLNENEIKSKIDISQAEYILKLTNQKLKIERSQNIYLSNPLYEKIFQSKTTGLVLFSSGTTGVPKAMLLDLKVFFNQLKPNRRPYKSLVFLMFDHIGGLNTLLQILNSHGTLVIPKNRDGAHVLELIQNHSVELLPTSPTFLNLILISEAYKDFNLSSLRYITYGTEPMPQTVLNKLIKIFPKVKFKQTYGLSELGIMKTESKSPDSLFMKIGGEGFDYKVLENQLFIKSDTSMVGYLNSENSFDEDGYFPTGDIVEQDEDGYLRIVGRIKEFINIGGQKVTPSEVEGVILEISEILDVIVKGEKNAIMGEMVVAYVVIDKNINQFEIKEKILEKCKASLESYKVPVKVKFLEKIIFSERFKKSRLINLEETS